MIKGLEVLERIKAITKAFDKDLYSEIALDIDDCKQALLKAQEQEKVLNIIKEKNVRIYWIKSYSCVESYNNGLPPKEQLTEEEFDLLKEILR